ncbi:hypothetical protein BC739_009071 [Kutzneria viridogrisea]|uniref:Uncharacterized protein n=1 Tax=Kutzneria viridogrisea TaxID=47990 RepID=A0ABR6BY42_9PSEU|nr:hypothetical protein [Kutzneria viridogrisea]
MIEYDASVSVEHSTFFLTNWPSDPETHPGKLDLIANLPDDEIVFAGIGGLGFISVGSNHYAAVHVRIHPSVQAAESAGLKPVHSFITHSPELAVVTTMDFPSCVFPAPAQGRIFAEVSCTGRDRAHYLLHEARLDDVRNAEQWTVNLWPETTAY